MSAFCSCHIHELGTSHIQQVPNNLELSGNDECCREAYSMCRQYLLTSIVGPAAVLMNEL
jgi:hypothetical protein